MVDPVKFGSNHVANVNPVNENLYYLKGYDEIMEYNVNNYQSRSVFKIPQSNSIIEYITFDTEGNIVFTVRGSYSPQLTLGAYNGGGTLIIKINTAGSILLSLRTIVLTQLITHITLDKFNNIYCVGKVNKNTVIPGNPFQASGDLTSIINSQDVIVKLNSSGQYEWSTFYSKDQSMIRAIAAADNGVYVYGDHMASTSSSNYFGTKGSYQEYATGVFTGSGGNEKNVFLSKFNTNGTRAWSTYYAVDRSMIPYSETLNYYGGLTVINNEPYILTKHEIRPIMTRNPTTVGAFLTQQLSMSQFDLTATKFSSTGIKLWSSFLYYGEAITTSPKINELFISGTFIENNQHAALLTTSNAHQTAFGGGRTDNYLFTLSIDGSKMNYGSFYGGAGSDYGLVLGSKNGFYTVGYSFLNNSTNTVFSTNPSLNQFTYQNGKEYWGTYISYFKLKSLGIDGQDYSNIKFSVYPNPTADILHIQTKDILPENTLFTIYDIAGKKIMSQNANSNEVNQINVSNLRTGAYILQISTVNNIKSVKFIKK